MSVTHIYGKATSLFTDLRKWKLIDQTQAFQNYSVIHFIKVKMGPAAL